MQISGKTRLLGLIGNPVEHTLSPAIHNSIASGEVYVPFFVEHGRLEDAVKGGYALNILGMNVTVPYKSEVIPFLKDIDRTADGIGAVNTLVRVDGGYKGYNTDAMGFGRELEHFGVDVAGKSAIMLGAGGAARAVAFQLCNLGIRDLTILNIDPDMTNALVADLKRINPDATINSGLLTEIGDVVNKFKSEHPGEKYFAVQCTSVGLAPKSDACVVEDGEFFDHMFAALDVIYKPKETKFMGYCKKHGVPAYNGERMLLYQGICAYELFTGKTVSEGAIEKAYRNMSAKTVILTGYMGTGKTTVGKVLAKQLHLPLFDTDELIESKTDMSISDIFAKYGEAAFRDMETELLKEIKEYYGPCVLSLGGGLVLREENRRLLDEIGVTFALSATADTIYDRVKGDTTRPLLQCEDPLAKIKQMLNDRAAAYEDAADHEVTTDNKKVSAICEEIVTIYKNY